MYGARDFEAIKDQLIEYARQNFPEWTDFNESEQGMILVELYSLIGDSLHRYIDRQTDEFDIDKVTQRVNMIALMKLIGYQMEGAKAATAQVNIDIEGGGTAGADVPIPDRFKIYTQDIRNPVVYEVLETGAKIAAGTTGVTVTATQGETETQFHTFDGTADQEVRLEIGPVIEGAVSLDIDGEIWSEVENLLDSTSTDPHFTIELNENDEATVKFGDGNAGKKPDGSGEFTYRVGGGTAGMVGPNTLIVPETPQLLDENGSPVTIVTNNPSSSEGGEDKEPIDEARTKGPQSSKSNERTVSRPDFKNHTLEIDGIDRAFPRFRDDVSQWNDSTAYEVGELIRPTTENGHYYEVTVAGTTATTEPSWPTTSGATVTDGTVTWKEHGPSVPANLARIQIVPDGGGQPSQAKIDEVKDHLYNEKPVYTTLVVDPITPKYKTIDVDVSLVLKPGYDQATAESETIQAITDFLQDYEATYTNGEYVLDWGMTIYPDDVAIKAEGVRSITVNIPSGPVQCLEDEIPAPGNVTVT